MVRNNFKLDFVGIGAEKAGTTWVADCLRDHPEVYIPKKKEIFFFNEYDPHFLNVLNPKYGWGIDWYKRQFDLDNGFVVGEYSPTYLYCKEAPKRIKKHFPNVKIIVVLRDPADRAFSQYIHDTRLGLIGNIEFEEALKRHKNYLEKGKYFRHLKRYFKVFNKENIFITTLDEIKKDPLEVMKKLHVFLGLKNVDFKSRKLYGISNHAGRPKMAILNSIMANTEYFLRRRGFSWILKPIENLGIRDLALKIRDLNSSKINDYPKMNEKIRKRLKKYYMKDTKKLEKLIDCDLSSWH